MRAYSSVALLLVVVATACSSTSSGSGGASNGSTSSKLCVETCEALARAAERCGGNYQQNYTAAVQNAAGGNCNNVISIRDQAALSGTCLPSLKTITCADLMGGRLDASCKSQLQRPASFTPTLVPASSLADGMGEEL